MILAEDILVSAVASAFDGAAIGQFKAWLNTITDCRAADYVRKIERRRTVPLSSEHDGEDGLPYGGPEAAVDGDYGASELHIVIDQILKTLNPLHSEVIRRLLAD
ncbi:MAG: hypothetical protein ACP5H2_09460 [Solirubrobacteraceae bacterium]